ncbi:hypothetical protein ARC20_07855 [Stenotrophomonas panacihumi]|uniref:Secreted protein n=1 Tax=Stenotrophomonas panacihumi TaxID=676599 RepID=A0A0R0AS45_9GAMM|nr:hypothetical protein [Stenotrophomonas panacihumi]KRG44810.1 hypothetical protein ARC20_07855 [Stenotrophomonas panacihumi]PTN54130.1 hypothetical protein C9J98_11535 [Stenotrophomonas panacihumi]
MRLSRPLVSGLALALALSLPAGAAFAQRAVSGDLQQEMTPAQFKAAGLDKLSATELAALNDWLQGKVAAETQKATAAVAGGTGAAALAQAREEGRQEVITKNRGFLDFGSKDPIESTIAGEFTGFGKGRHYVLANGQEWEQTESTELRVRKDSPKVKIKPGLMGVWYLQVDGYNTMPKVRRVK